MRFAIFLILFSTILTNAYDERVLELKNTDISIGIASAPIKMIEYSSFTCHACAAYHNTLFSLIKTQYIDTGKIFYILRESIAYKQDLDASMLIRCYSPNEMFENIEYLFQKQSQWVYNKNYNIFLENFAQSKGISKDEYQKCLNNDKITDILMENTMDLVNNLNVNATPIFIINKKIVRGFHRQEILKIIENEIKNAQPDTSVYSK